MSFVTLEQKGPVGIITMNRPDALNALNEQVLRDLDAWSFLMGSAWSGMWGSLPAILTIGMLATLAIGEVVIWRQIFRFAVR